MITLLFKSDGMHCLLVFDFCCLFACFYNFFVYVLSCFSNVRLFVTLWTVAHQAPLCMEFSRQKYWSGLVCPPPGALPNPGIKPRSLALQEDSLPSEPPGKLPYVCVCIYTHTHIWANEMATHSSILAWRITWTEEPGGLQYIESQKNGM